MNVLRSECAAKDVSHSLGSTEQVGIWEQLPGNPVS